MEEEEKISGEESAAEQAEEGAAEHAGEPAQEALQQPSAEPVVRASLRLDGALQKRMYGTTMTAMFLAVFAGAVLVVLSVVLRVLEDRGILFDAAQDSWLWLGALLCACGLVCVIVLSRARKTADANVRVNLYDFYAEEFVVTTKQEERTICVSRIRYGDCRKFREEREFFTIAVPAAGTYVVDKVPLTEQERAALRELLHLPPKSSKKK